MVMLDVILDERRNEIIAVVVTDLPTQDELLTGLLCRCFQRLGLELHADVLIGIALINEDFAGERLAAHQDAGVPFLPTGAIRS